jgi:hypothetical protein
MSNYIIALIVLCSSAVASASEALRVDIASNADFLLKIRSSKLDFLDFGFGRKTPEGFFRPFLVPREDAAGFLRAQKHKDMVAVEYYHLSLEGDALSEEVSRTVQYFRDIGFSRIMLLMPTNQGVMVLHDTSGIYKSGYFEWHDRPGTSEPTKSGQETLKDSETPAPR